MNMQGSGQTVDVKPRNITIYNAKLISFNKEKSEITLEIYCSKGTYIRTVCEDFAKKLNTIGYMKELRRIKVGEFSIEKSIDFEKMRNDESIVNDKIITIEEYFKNKEEMELTKRELELFLNGVQLNKEYSEGIYRIYSNNIFIGIATCKDNKIKRDVLVN